MIGIKSWRPRRRFSLLPHGERSGQLRSRRPRGSLKFPLLVVFIASTRPSFLGRRFLRCVATLLLELIFTSSPAHPLRRAYAPTTCSSSSILDWLGLGIKESSLHRVLRHRLRHPLSREISASVRGLCLCAHSAVLSAFVLFAVGAGLARCWLPSHPGEVAICMRPSGPLHRCQF